ncbi:MAG TPA: glycosyltransferase [Stellaceae bacterium]|nr:glycosyltransferase [Stellaceae bacterium]
MKILLLVRSLGRGGAERQLVELATGLQQRGHGVAVAVFYDGGPLSADLLAATGIRPRVIGKSGRWDVLGLARGLARIVADERPDLVHSFLTTPNIATLVARVQWPQLPLVWGVLGTDWEPQYDGFAHAMVRAEGLLARYANLIVSDSHVGRTHAIARGFPADRTIVIPSGVDLERFKEDTHSRRRVRAEWGIANHEILIGLVARMDPMKDHATFLRAAAALSAERRNVRFVCVGDLNPIMAASLQELAAGSGLGNRLIWAGPRGDMPAVHNALDIGCSSSAFGEGFSNALLEAMACGRLCVATDVGDAREILGELGRIVPPRDSQSLARALASLCDELGGPAGFHPGTRERVIARFSRERMVAAFEAEYLRLLQTKNRRAA